ncbi:MAG: ABC transporter substrate-binding protein [Verrucomicrobiae bacterium]|nr:ABC transporter substrate-binding protein [Verrucomicrobiae bacterium]
MILRKHQIESVMLGLATAMLGMGLSGCGQPIEIQPYDNTAEVQDYYEAHPDFFTFATPADIPADLVWETGMDQPEIGDDNAKKGGVMNLAISAYPPTYRTFGPDSNHQFRDQFYDNVEMSLVGLHPETMEVIPSIANEWAVTADHQTVYFRIDPAATYSDGVPITADDCLMTFYLYQSDYANAPFHKQYYSEEYTNITKYDERTISITLKTPKPKAAYEAAILPSPTHFFKEFGPDYPQRYQWRVKPVTGAYVIDEEKTSKGRSITLRRVTDWWAKDKKFVKNRFNPDFIRYRLVRSTEKEFELFRNGEIDYYLLNDPRFWYEKTEIPAVYNGYIKKAVFYNDYPRVPRGLYINCSQPLLDDVNIRVGMQFASNVQKLIDFDFRGDYKRSNIFCAGYGEFSEPTIRARPFDPAKAREAFAKAGFNKRGEDGILKRDDGTRLSFTISTQQDPLANRILLRLKEEAAKAGLEYQIESLDGTAFFQKVMEKKHQICLWGWGATPPYPRYFQNFHSSNAYDEGSTTPKPNTNNITQSVDPRLDELSLAIRRATTEDEIREKSYAIEHVIHEQAPWVPLYVRNYYRFGYWRWLKFPEGSFNVRVSNDPDEAHVHWIDMEAKEETLEAKREGRTFPETLEVFDQHLVE